MADEVTAGKVESKETSRPADRLCHAPSDQIPHPPHIWVGLVLSDDLSTPLAFKEWYCDGWMMVLPDFLRTLKSLGKG